MTNLNIRIGFTTDTNSLVSRLVRWLTRSECSHAIFIYFDQDWGVDMVLEASDVGFREIPLSNFLKKNTLVRTCVPKVPLEEGLKYVALTYLGTTFDYTGLLGNGPILLGRWLKRKWNNPWNTPGSVFCSEAVVVAMQQVEYPGAETLVPMNTSPQDLLEFMEKA
jgi:hypothetical protein